MKLCWLMLAGALGTLARYALTQTIDAWWQRGAKPFGHAALGAHFPLATLLINVAGTFMLSFLVGAILHHAVKPELRLILGTGFLGAFTTFSTFGLEAETLLANATRDGKWLAPTVYISGNLLLGLLAVVAGRALALRIFVS